VTKEELLRIGYSESAQVLRHQESLLFQRLNYFLVANAFLITAFATIFVNIFNNPPLWGFGLIISLSGILISFTFSAVNLYNAKIIELLYTSISKIENELTNIDIAPAPAPAPAIDTAPAPAPAPAIDTAPAPAIDTAPAPAVLPYGFLKSQLIEQRKEEFKYTWKIVFAEPFLATYQVVTAFCHANNSKIKRIIPALHTWAVPLFFFVFWVIALVIYLIVICLNIPIRF
jgi:hypothetical protein